jgi:hypothetical protein
MGIYGREYIGTNLVNHEVLRFSKNTAYYWDDCKIGFLLHMQIHQLDEVGLH